MGFDLVTSAEAVESEEVNVNIKQLNPNLRKVTLDRIVYTHN